MQITKHLSYFEATHSDTAVKNKINNQPNEVQLILIERLASAVFEPLREWANEPIRINSLFRCEELNSHKDVKGATTSQHLCRNGAAMDIKSLGKKTNAELFNYIKDNLEFDQLIWEYGTDKNPQWVHVSYNKGKNRNQILFTKNKKQ